MASEAKAAGPERNVLADLGISGASIVFGSPGRTSIFGPIMTGTSTGTQGLLGSGGLSPWLEYDFIALTARTLGVRANRSRVDIPRHRMLAISRLEDVVP